MEFPLEKLTTLKSPSPSLQDPPRVRFNTLSDVSHSSYETTETFPKQCPSSSTKPNFPFIFYRNEHELRTSYYNKLIQHKYISSFTTTTTPVIKRDYNSILIFDWDDTLLCSSYLIKHNYFIDETNEHKLNKYKDKLVKLENYVYTLLAAAIQYGDTYIITNASYGWVEFSARKYYPKVVSLFNSLRIISARHIYEKDYPNNAALWKYCTFINVANLYDKQRVANIIAFGDSDYELEAANKMGMLFNEAFVKTVKFQKEPKPEAIVQQLNLVIQQINDIHSATRNMMIKVNKKKYKEAHNFKHT